MRLSENNQFKNEYRTGNAHIPHTFGRLLLTGGLVIGALLLLFAATNLPATPWSGTKRQPMLTSLSGEGGKRGEVENAAADSSAQEAVSLGIVCQKITPFCQTYYELPAGLYVVRVLPDSLAARLGILPGDALVQVNNSLISQPVFLDFIISQSVGEEVSLTISRKGKIIPFSFTPEE